jgi:8-oxo-dGTP pyrophosphatase MutT (NUDIX family)
MSTNNVLPFMILEDVLIPADAVAGIIVLDDGRYLMQLRDCKRGIFYPGHWGLFGGAVDVGEDKLAALRRELMEELQFSVEKVEYFTGFDFDFSFAGHGKKFRAFYEVPIMAADLPHLVLNEGAGMQAFTAAEILMEPRVVPYDAFAIWMHANRNRLLVPTRLAAG